MANNNVEIQAQFNKMLEEASRQLEKQTTFYKTQAEILAQMVRAQQLLSGTTDADKYEKLAESLENASNNAEKYLSHEKSLNKMSEAMDANRTASVGMESAVLRAAKAMAKVSIAKQGLLGVANGFAFVGKTVKTALGVTGALLKTMGHLGASIISFPFKILQNLIDEASHGGSNELAMALEEIRKQLGYLKKQGGGAVVELGRSMRGELANTGLSVYRIFGSLAERLKYFLEYAKALGPIFDTMASKIGEGGGEALGAFNKALGLSGEAQRGIAARAMATGKTINSVNLQVANYAVQLSDAFGVTMKEVSRSVGEMLNDFENFGHLAPKQLTQVAVYARKLGIEIKALQGIMDKTLNFEDAATQAAQLSQAFGLNLDALEQMKEQDPGKQLDNLRKAFFNAGRSVEGMTRQERKLLQQQTGLDAASLDLAFSLKNQSLSYDQIQKKGAAAERKQLSQAEAMQKLAGAIERLVQSGDLGSGGFFDRFLRGINAGMKRTAEWRKIMMNLRSAMWSTFQAGTQVGRMIVKVFPGVKETFQSIAEFFEPRKFKTMLQKVVEGFRTFFNDLTVNPRQALPKLLERLRKGFFDYFSSNSAPGKKLLDGTKKFFMAFATIGNSYLKIAGDGIVKGLKFVIGLLNGQEKLDIGRAASSGRGALGFFGPIVMNLLSGLKPLFMEIYKQLTILTGILWDRFKEWITPSLPKILLGLIGPSIVMSLTRMFGATLITAFGNGLVKAITSNTIKDTASRALASQGSSIIGKAQETLTKGPKGGLPDSAGIMRAGNSVSAEASKGKAGPGVIKQLLLMAGIVAIGLAAVFAAVLLIRKYEVTREEIVKTAGLMLASVPMIVAAGLVTKILSGLPKGNVKDIAIGLLFVAGTATLMAIHGAAMVQVIRKFNYSTNDIAKAGLLMGAISGLYLAASAVVAVGGIIGGIVAASGGIAAAAIIGGVVFIGLVAHGMVESGMSLMRTIDRFRPAPGFVEKGRLFVDFIKALGTFAGNIGSIMAAVAPGITGMIGSVIFGNDPQVEMRRTLGQVSVIISAIGSESIRILDAVMRYSTRMSVEQLNKGKILGEIMEGIGNFTKALMPSADLLKDTSAWWENSDVSDKLRIVNNSLTRTAESMQNVMRTIGSTLSQLRGVSGSRIGETASVMSTVMGAVGNLAQNLMPRAATIQAINGARDFSGALRNVRDFMLTLLREIINTNILDTFATFTNNFIRSAAGMSENDARKVTVVAPVLAKSFEAISQLSSLMSNVLPTNISRPVDARVIRSLTEFVQGFLQNIQNTIPNVMRSFTEIARNITASQADNMKKAGEAIASVFQTLGTIPNLIRSFDHQEENAQGGDVEARARRMGQNINMAMRGLTLIVGRVFSSGILTDVFNKLKNIQIPANAAKKLEVVSKTFEVIGLIPGLVTRFQEGVTTDTTATQGQQIASKVTAMITGVNNILGALSAPTVNGVANPFVITNGQAWIGNRMATVVVPRNVEAKLTRVSTTIESLINIGNRLSGIEMRANVGNAVAGLVHEANLVSTELSRVEPIRIEANLRRLAQNLGMGSTSRFQIQQSRVTLNFDAKINIDSKELETALVERANSRFVITAN